MQDGLEPLDEPAIDRLVVRELDLAHCHVAALVLRSDLMPMAAVRLGVVRRPVVVRGTLDVLALHTRGRPCDQVHFVHGAWWTDRRLRLLYLHVV